VAKYLFLALALPFVELYLLITVGRQLGAAPTLALVLAAGLIGSWVAKKEGLRVLRKWQTAHAEGRVPEEGLVSAALVWVGGVLLIIPGFLTDAMGLFLLLPPSRRWLSGRFRRGLERRMQDGTVRVTCFEGTFGGTFHSDHAAAPPRPKLEESAGEGASRSPRKALGEEEAEFTEEGPKS
jgi:UPF0716 protein FxsA